MRWAARLCGYSEDLDVLAWLQHPPAGVRVVRDPVRHYWLQYDTVDDPTTANYEADARLIELVAHVRIVAPRFAGRVALAGQPQRSPR